MLQVPLVTSKERGRKLILETADVDQKGSDVIDMDGKISGFPIRWVSMDVCECWARVAGDLPCKLSGRIMRKKGLLQTDKRYQRAMRTTTPCSSRY